MSKQKVVNADESRNEKFVRIAGKRLRVISKQLYLITKMVESNNYDITEDNKYNIKTLLNDKTVRLVTALDQTGKDRYTEETVII
jgi:hypothetical protein